jgi:histidinol-phosphatase (PHP family)
MMNELNRPWLVSVHGGHSGQFCNHARDTLEEIVRAYIEQGFAWAGLTEHIPPSEDRFLFPDEVAAGLTAAKMRARFAHYIETGRRLQHKYASSIRILVGCETETYCGYDEFVPALVREFQPDYIVGSLHHVDDISFDVTPADYQRVAETAGGINALYARYFDQQLEMINTLKPAVVGHFDYIRIFDPDYPTRLEQPAIWQRILRNLARIKELDLILDFNVRALSKGAREPYISRPILVEAIKLGIPIVPGDDSHGTAEVGQYLDVAIEILEELGADTQWRMP